MHFINKISSIAQKYSRWLIPLILLSIFCFFYFYNITGWLIHDDEGGYLYHAWRMSQGELPYRDFYSTKEPFFLYTGYLIFSFLGPDVLWVRIFTAIITILTGCLIFLIGRRVYSYKVGFWSSVTYLVLPVVYFQARRYRPDAYAVFFSVLGLFLFIKAWQDNKNSFFAYSGISYAVSLGYKLSTFIGITAVLIFIFYQAATQRRLRIISRVLVLFIGGFFVAIVASSIFLNKISFLLLTCIFKHELSQPLLLFPNLITTVVNNIKEFLMIGPKQYGLRDGHSWFIIFSLPLAICYLFASNQIRKIFSFLILCSCFILLAPYPNQILRYYLYVVPVAVLISVSFLCSLFQHKRSIFVRIFGALILVFILIKVILPGLKKDSVLFLVKEDGTALLAEYIKNNTRETDYVMAEYGDILFHARRKTTYLMAGMSQSAIDNGVITSDKLINELENYPVKMVLIHREGGISEKQGFFFGTPYAPHHFSTLINSKDGPKFISYLHKHYLLTDTLNRSGEIFDIYYKKESLNSLK